MAQAAVILRRAHEKERRRRELENIIDHSVTVNHNSDTSLSGAGRNSSPETFYQNKKIETGCSLNQSPEKEVWVGHVCALFFPSAILFTFSSTRKLHNQIVFFTFQCLSSCGFSLLTLCKLLLFDYLNRIG